MKILINVDVWDIDTAVRFYRSALGLKRGRRLGNYFAELTGGSSRIYLLREKQGSRPIPNRPTTRHYSRHWTPVHLDFAVRDIAKAAEKAVRAGAEQEGRIRKQVYGFLANFSDPFGNGFCLIQFTGRGYDELIRA